MKNYAVTSFVILLVVTQVTSTKTKIKSVEANVPVECNQTFPVTMEFAIVTVANSFVPDLEEVISTIQQYKHNTNYQKNCLHDLVIKTDDLSTTSITKSNIEKCIREGFTAMENVGLGVCKLLMLADRGLNLPCLKEPTCWVDILMTLHNNFDLLESFNWTPLQLLDDVHLLLKLCIKNEVAEVRELLQDYDLELEIEKCLVDS